MLHHFQCHCGVSHQTLSRKKLNTKLRDITQGTLRVALDVSVSQGPPHPTPCELPGETLIAEVYCKY